MELDRKKNTRGNRRLELNDKNYTKLVLARCNIFNYTNVAVWNYMEIKLTLYQKFSIFHKCILLLNSGIIKIYRCANLNYSICS